MNETKKRKFSSGVTLTELIVVVGIIAFLALMAMLYLRSQLFKGKDARRKGDLHEIQIAVEEYEKDNNCYPLPNIVICNPGTGLKPYVSKIPCDPDTDASYYYDHEDSLCPSWYRIYTTLGNIKDDDVMGNIGPLGDYNFYLSSTNAPTPDVYVEYSDSYGCFSGVCLPVPYNEDRGGSSCDTHFANPLCSGLCGSPSNPTNECIPWNE